MEFESKNNVDGFQKERDSWTEKIKVMNSKISKIIDITELLTEVYSDRQIAVDRHTQIMEYIIKINKVYRSKYAERYDHYTINSQIRYTNETVKINKIQADLSDILLLKESLEIQLKFFEGTIKTIDNLIYGINNRIKIEEFIRGFK